MSLYDGHEKFNVPRLQSDLGGLTAAVLREMNGIGASSGPRPLEHVRWKLASVVTRGPPPFISANSWPTNALFSATFFSEPPQEPEVHALRLLYYHLSDRDRPRVALVDHRPLKLA